MIDDDRNVLKRILVDKESWHFMCDPETKYQSASWLYPEKPRAEKVKI
jgi:hypothetical protein